MTSPVSRGFHRLSRPADAEAGKLPPVYVRGPGAVVRCRRCTSVLMVIARVRRLNCVDLSGLAALEATRAPND